MRKYQAKLTCFICNYQQQMTYNGWKKHGKDKHNKEGFKCVNENCHFKSLKGLYKCMPKRNLWALEIIESHKATYNLPKKEAPTPKIADSKKVHKCLVCIPKKNGGFTTKIALNTHMRTLHNPQVVKSKRMRKKKLD